MDNKLNSLEQTIMELGTEIYRLRSDLTVLKEDSDKYRALLGTIKRVLDDKDIVTIEDFDLLLNEHELNSFEREGDAATERELSRFKKSTH